MKVIQLINFCLALVGASVYSGEIFSASQQPLFTKPDNFCKIFMTRSVNSEIVEGVQAVVSDRMKVLCKVADKWVGQGLESQERKNFLGSADTFVFWIDFDRNKEEVVLAIFSPQSGLRWAQTRARIGNLKSQALLSILGDSLENLLGQIPFVGYWTSQGFFAWSRSSSLKVRAVKGGVPEKHPFLPEEKWNPGQAMGPALILSMTSTGLVLRSSDGSSLLSAPSERLWLSPTRD